jgi:hypothetical protein
MCKISIKNILLSGLLFCFILQPQLSLAQWFYSLYLEQEYNTNPFGLPLSEDDQISRISMGLQKDWEKVSAQYFGSYHGYYQNFERSFYWQQFYMGGGDSTSWSLLAENRLNRPDYQIYNYLSVRGGINQNQVIKNFLWRLSGGVTLNNFMELPDLNNLLFTTYTSLQRSFVTRTSFIGTAAFNYKYYLREIAVTDSAELFLPSVSQLYQGGGPGPGHGGPGDGSGYDVYVPSSEQRGLAQLLLTLRLAQSLTSYTGLAVQYQVRFNFSEYDRSVTGLVYGYSSESQIFDDPMGYESQMWGMELTQLLPYQISIKAAGYYQQKNYVAQGSYLDDLNFDQSILREDLFRTIWGTLEKRFSLWEASLALQVNYQWIDNSSNSYWYDYVSQFISLGIQADL